MARLLLSNILTLLMIAIILLLKRILKNKVSLKFHYYIWFMLLFSLGIAFLPKSFLKSPEFYGVTQRITAPVSSTSKNRIGAPDLPRDWRYDITEITDTMAIRREGIIVTIIWSAGMLAVMAFYVLGNRKMGTIKKSSKHMPESILNIFDRCIKRLSVSRKIILHQSDAITSPLCFGYGKPYILLPENIIEECSEREIEHILLHELTHIKNRDIWVNLYCCLLQMIYWFNPFIWWAFFRMRQEREAYCDWSVLNICCNEEERLGYAETLLQFAGRRNHTRLYTANRLYFHKNQLKYRIEQIAEYKEETRKTKVLGGSFTAVLIFMIILQIPVYAAVASEFGLLYEPSQEIQMIEQDYSELFKDASGCAIVYDMQLNVYNVYNASAITKRTAPCSTYKIYSALNALEGGIITTADNTIKWDYVTRDIPSWNDNQNLNSAMQNSANWYFQYLDNAAGTEELEKFYQRIGYGNGYIGNDTDYYWNGSSLKISPLEQVELLVKLYKNEFGLKEENVKAVKNAIMLKQVNGNTLYGKTGTGKIGSNNVCGWFIGYLECADNTYFFAVNIQDKSNADGKTAASIANSIFHKTGITIHTENDELSEGKINLLTVLF